METSWATASTRHSAEINIFCPPRPTQLSSHHSCRQEGGGQRRGTDIVVLAIYHLARSRSARRTLVFRPRGTFTIGEPSFPRDPFHTSRFFLILVTPARTNVWLVIGVIVRTYARTHPEAKRILNVLGERGRCGVPWEKRRRVISRRRVRTRGHASPCVSFFHSVSSRSAVDVSIPSNV